MPGFGLGKEVKMKPFAVYRLSQCPDCDEEGNLNGFEAVYTDGYPIAMFTYHEDAIDFAKSKGDAYFVINLQNAEVMHMGAVKIDTSYEDKFTALKYVVQEIIGEYSAKDEDLMKGMVCGLTLNQQNAIVRAREIINES